jgi:uncharacterized protein YdaU (DUF1376 family)
VNYYPHHLGDYAKDTAHLSMLEDGAYRRLLDRYYGTEKPIPAAEAHRVCRARTAQEKVAVDAVVREFFKERDGLLYQSRAEREIESVENGRRRSAENGKKGGRPPKPEKTQQVISGYENGNLDESKVKASRARSHSPITQEPDKERETPREREAPCRKEEAWSFAQQMEGMILPWSRRAFDHWWATREVSCWLTGGGHTITRSTWREDLRTAYKWAHEGTDAPRKNGSRRRGDPEPLSTMETNLKFISEDV